jgi:hypothetical protein
MNDYGVGNLAWNWGACAVPILMCADLDVFVPISM